MPLADKDIGFSAVDFETAKLLARSPDARDRRLVAEQPNIRPELLYFLTTDQSPDVRRAVAANPTTPRQADLLLVGDSDMGVREGLARKIARLIPGLSQEQVGQIERLTVDLLETLAKDQAAEVRRVLSEELKSLPNAPASVIHLLAHDLEIAVAAPVLSHSPILSDDDLLEIIISGPIEGALSAIARRADVAPMVADAIAASDDIAAITVLLGNPSAQVREETLDRIIDRAPEHESWHRPLVQRPRLPSRAATRLAQFVAESLVRTLQARTDLDPATAQELANVVKSRLDRRPATPSSAAEAARHDVAAPASPLHPAGLTAFVGVGRRKTRDKIEWKPIETGSGRRRSSTAAPVEPPPAAAAAGDVVASPGARAIAGTETGRSAERLAMAQAQELHKAGKLDEASLSNALAEGDRLFVCAGLAELSGASLASVHRIVGSHSPRAVTALVWKAGLSMRFARQAQLGLALIPPRSALSARHDDTFPLSESDMRWQLGFFADN